METKYLITLIGCSGISLGLGIFFTYITSRRFGKNTSGSARVILEKAKEDASHKIREAELECKEIIYKTKLEMQNEYNLKRDEYDKKENNYSDKENKLQQKLDSVDVRERELKEELEEGDLLKEQLASKQKDLNQMQKEYKAKLAQCSHITAEEAKEELLNCLKVELKEESAQWIRKFQEEIQLKSKRVAKQMILEQMHGCVSQTVQENTLISISLPNDEFKGKLIGKEGRNIRAFENFSGVDLIIDDTPESVMISSMNPYHREIAKIALTKLIAEGRIHPTRIEEQIENSKKEIKQVTIDEGEKAVQLLQIGYVCPEIIEWVGKLKYLSVEGQNALNHSLEVAQLMGQLAKQLECDSLVAKKIGLFHYLSKESHPRFSTLGSKTVSELFKEYNENENVISALESYSKESEDVHPLAEILDLSKKISLARPGGTDVPLDTYLKRLKNLEELVSRFDEVDKVYILHSGKEIRAIVNSEKTNDDESVLLSRKIAKIITEQIEYPGSIKVCVIRENKSIVYAN